jgi:hypothetical protein
MRITVKRTGGFAGVSLERTVDTSESPDARELEELVRSARLDAVPERSGQPDRFTYEIDVDGRRVRVGEPDLDGPLHTLVQRVLQQG